MKCCLGIFLLLSFSPLLAQNKKLDGYVLDAAAFGKIQSYCVDTHNLPPDQAEVIDHFVSQESKPKGLLTKLPWHRVATCQDAGLDGIVRMEFPHGFPSSPNTQNHVMGVLLVFRPGSPSPIYETPAVTIPGEPGRNDDDEFSGKVIGNLLEYDALRSVVRVLIHDWQIR
ncbi:MAG: hypothetical protein ABSF45_13085 [Terriglobia bacterium]